MKSRAFFTKMMADRNVSDVCFATNIRSNQIYDWLKGRNRIYPQSARKLAQYFRVGPENFLEEWYEIDPADHSFGAEIKRRRLRMGFSLMDLSHKLGYADKTICNWEHNQLRENKHDEIRKLFESVESDFLKMF